MAQLDASDSRYMKVYSRSAVAVMIPISAVHVQTAPAVSMISAVALMIIAVAAHPAIAVDADFTAIPLRAGRARNQHRSSEGRHGCSN